MLTRNANGEHLQPIPDLKTNFNLPTLALGFVVVLVIYQSKEVIFYSYFDMKYF